MDELVNMLVASGAVSIAHVPELTFEQLEALSDGWFRTRALNRAQEMEDLRTVLADAFSEDSTLAAERISQLYAVFTGADAEPPTRQITDDVLRL